MSEATTRRRDVFERIEAIEQRFREERERHVTAQAAIRADLHEVMREGDELGLSLTSMAKALKISRGRLKRLLATLR
jgi:predicted DNA-binding protein (UPF0251 family)